MIKKIMFVSLLLAGIGFCVMAQTPQGQAVVGCVGVDDGTSRGQTMTIAQLFEKIEQNSKSLRTVKSGVA